MSPKPQAKDYAPRFGDPVADWYAGFAILPIRTENRGWVWLRRVWYRRIQKHDYLDGGADFWWQYAA